MILKLQVTNDPISREPTVFRDTGGTIGRAEGCTLLLPDGYVSNSHARISYRDGTFFIEDTSQNGTWLNSPSKKLVKGQPYPLKSDDLLLVDPYEIKVTVESGLEARPVAPQDDVFAVTGLGPFAGREPANNKGSGRSVRDLPDPEIGQDPFLPPDPIAPSPGPSSGPLIPDDESLDFTNPGAEVRSTPPAPVRPSDPTPARVPRPPDTPESPRRTGELSEVMKGAGLPPDLVTPELAQDFGRIIRIIVHGLIEVLRSRQEIKRAFRLDHTNIQPTGNNPLKFSMNVEDALQRLFVKNRAYLEPVPAFQDAYDDVLHHQMAMLTGMRAAFDAMLKSFDPDVLQAEFDKQGKSGLISGPAKLRYWDQYRVKFGDMVHDADCFQNLFGEEFANAYDEQLERLKAEGRSTPQVKPPSGRSRR